MDWKDRIKWKVLIILAALAGILIVWCAGKAGEKKGSAEAEILREYALKENEWASAGIPFREAHDFSEKAAIEDSSAGTADTRTFASQSSGEEKSSVPQTEEQTIEERGEASLPAASQETNIRVLLMSSGYESYYHQQVSLCFQGSCQVEGTEQVFQDQETLNLSPDSPELAGGSITLTPKQQEGRIQVTSINRGQGNPAYLGSLTIYKDDKGLRIVNTLPLEDYLRGVVPSEMPASYPSEALKAQAVCARTYACVQMEGSSLEDLGAQVDDSVSFQVYQNSGEDQAASQAVEETRGQILLNNGTPINAYYFSTSHGKTSTDEVWEAAAPASYLKSVDCTYDSGEPWYQWQVTLPMARLLENVQSLYGEIHSISGAEIREKGEGEAVLNLALYTDQGEKEIHSEYDIRSVLAPKGLSITRQDGSQVKGSSLLPSAYFSLEETRDDQGQLAAYVIKGGGYGHGVGMSQNGARGMAEAGKNYEEILTYFYKDVEIGNIKDIAVEK